MVVLLFTSSLPLSLSLVLVCRAAVSLPKPIRGLSSRRGVALSNSRLARLSSAMSESAEMDVTPLKKEASSLHYPLMSLGILG